MGKPARSDVDRSGDARCRAEHLYPQGREGRWRALQHRICDLRGGEGSHQGSEESFALAFLSNLPPLALGTCILFSALFRASLPPCGGGKPKPRAEQDHINLTTDCSYSRLPRLPSGKMPCSVIHSRASVNDSFVYGSNTIRSPGPQRRVSMR